MATNIVILVFFSLCICVTPGARVDPCPNVPTNYACVGDFLSKVSHCSKTLRKSSNFDPYFTRYEFQVLSPSTKTREIWHRTNYTGMNLAYLTEFYYDNVTATAAVTIVFPNFKIHGDMQIFGVASEPIPTLFTAFYEQLTLRTEFANVNKININKGKVTATFGDAPQFTYEGDILKPNNQRAVAFLNAVKNNPQVHGQEYFSQRGIDHVIDVLSMKVCNYY